MSERVGEVELVAAAALRMAVTDRATRALALVGSGARGDGEPDSDVDLVLLTEKPQRYLDDDDWIEALNLVGPVVVAPPRPWGAITERRLTLGSGLEVDLGVSLPSWASTDPVDAGTHRVVADGIRLVHDPDHLLADLAAACGAAARPWLPASMTLDSPDVHLREWTDDDAPALRTVCGDPNVCRFTSVPWAYSLEAAREWVDRQHRLRAEGKRLALAITAPGRPLDPLGTVNLGRISADGRKAALGYWLLPIARGRGLATTAARVLACWGFERLGLERIELAILPENVASRRLAERLGARDEGIRPESRRAEGRAWDMAIYSLETNTTTRNTSS